MPITCLKLKYQSIKRTSRSIYDIIISNLKCAIEGHSKTIHSNINANEDST